MSIGIVNPISITKTQITDTVDNRFGDSRAGLDTTTSNDFSETFLNVKQTASRILWLLMDNEQQHFESSFLLGLSSRIDSDVSALEDVRNSIRSILTESNNSQELSKSMQQFLGLSLTNSNDCDDSSLLSAWGSSLVKVKKDPISTNPEANFLKVIASQGSQFGQGTPK